MQEEPKGVHYIPKSALIPVKIGSGFIQRLQRLLIFLIQDKTPEEIELLQKALEDNSAEEDSWMYQYETIQTMILIIEKTAIDLKITEFREDQPEI